MRTLKEQEYQLLAMKYRHENWSKDLLLEVILGILITYALLQWHIVPAGFFGAWSILSVRSIFKRWKRYAREYGAFKADFDAMMERGR